MKTKKSFSQLIHEQLSHDATTTQRGFLNCNNIEMIVNDYLLLLNGTKVNHLEGCKKEEACECEREGKCQTALIPKIKPCISISWGDSDCDCIETDDCEVMHITVCNCYDNVTFKDFSIGFLYVTDENGQQVPTLPDGTPAVQIFPIGPYCFGDIGPCVEGKPTCKSRQFVLYTRGAKGGNYHLNVGVVCYDVVFHYEFETCFELSLCKS